MTYLHLPGVRPIQHLLSDGDISEIMINGRDRLFVERRGVMEQLEPVFANDDQLTVLIENLVRDTGRTVTFKNPFVDLRLPDGARVNIVIPPIALDGPVITIRKMTSSLSTVKDLVARGTLTERMAYFLYLAILGRLNLVFAGGTASGKTTTLGLLSAYIPANERIVVIEDTAELVFAQPHVVRLECRNAAMEGGGAVTLADLLKNSLRMRPTRIIVGEIRGEEAFDMLNAMSSGHDGCLAVMHASSPAHAMSRLELMVLSRGTTLPLSAIQRQIAAAVDVVVQHALLPDGTRRVTHISDVAGVGTDEVALRTLYEYDFHSGTFTCTGAEPTFIDKLRRAGNPDQVQGLFAPGRM